MRPVPSATTGTAGVYQVSVSECRFELILR